MIKVQQLLAEYSVEKIWWIRWAITNFTKKQKQFLTYIIPDQWMTSVSTWSWSDKWAKARTPSLKSCSRAVWWMMSVRYQPDERQRKYRHRSSLLHVWMKLDYLPKMRLLDLDYCVAGSGSLLLIDLITLSRLVQGFWQWRKTASFSGIPHA